MAEKHQQPSVILLEFFVSKKFADNFLSNTRRVSRNPKRQQELNQKRQEGTTGVRKYDLRHASLDYLEEDLEDNGFYLENIHIIPSQQTTNMVTLVMHYSKHFSKDIMPDPTGRMKLFTACWRRIRLYENPSEEEKVVHVIHASTFEKDRSPRAYLRYINGTWETA